MSDALSDVPGLPDADDARAVLKARARALARPAAAVTPSARRSMVVFSLGDERYALETRYVAAVSRMAEVCPLPGAAAHVLGLTSVQGELLVVFDLRVLMGIACAPPTDATRMMVLGGQRAEFAIIADAVHDVHPQDERDLFSRPAAADGERAYLLGVTSEAVTVFDGSALLADPRLYVDESGVGLMP